MCSWVEMSVTAYTTVWRSTSSLLLSLADAQAMAHRSVVSIRWYLIVAKNNMVQTIYAELSSTLGI